MQRQHTIDIWAAPGKGSEELREHKFRFPLESSLARSLGRSLDGDHSRGLRAVTAHTEHIQSDQTMSAPPPEIDRG